MPIGIPTLYQGIEFRSRLEAKWAAFFDLLGWRWEYEPIDGDGYIPDFAIYNELCRVADLPPIYAEIKPAQTKAAYKAPMAKMRAGMAEVECGELWVLGSSPLPECLKTDRFDKEYSPFALAHTTRNVYLTRNWVSCCNCGKWMDSHNAHDITSAPSGMSSFWDDLYYCASIKNPVTHSIESLWAQATNEVKWKGRNANRHG